jgi:tetratricopeptide (TPR) repeat protein
MNNTLEYIESYFQQRLNEEERRSFETKCEQDEAFAEEVAFYITARQALREELLQQKEAQWKEENVSEEDIPEIAPAKRSIFRSWLPYAAAACLVLAASVYLFEATISPQKFANNYVTKNYSQLSQTMDGDLKDSLQRGIASYNNKEYDKALQMFEGIEKQDPGNSDAKKYAGLAYLQMKNYDKALEQFSDLANMKDLFSNSGDFLKAITLLERNKPRDKEEAQTLLQKVVNENEDGSNDAKELLKKF